MQYDKRDNPVVGLTFDFTLKIVELNEKMSKNRQYNLSNQLFRSETLIGENVRKAQNAESKTIVKNSYC